MNDDGDPRQDSQPVAFEPQLADDLRLEQADHVRGGGDFIARPQLFGRGAAAEDVSAFEHADFAAGFGEIGGADQPVVPAADDDAVESAVTSHCKALPCDEETPAEESRFVNPAARARGRVP